MKFSTKKFIKDREKSTERSRKGELSEANLLPDKHGIRLVTSSLAERLRKQRHLLYEKAEHCNHKLACGCDLPNPKRTKPECEACL